MTHKFTRAKTAIFLIGVIIAVVLAFIGFQQIKSSIEATALLQSQIVSSLQNLNAEIEAVKRRQEEISSPERFRKAVIAAIESYGQQQRAQALRQRFETYAAAPDGLIDGKRIYGSATAQFTLVEFSDLECPYCKRFHATAKEVVDRSNGQINWEWRHMPLDFHQPAAGIEAHAAECVGSLAGNRAFWLYLEDIFAASNGGGQGTNELMRLAADLSVDPDAFKACMQAGEHQKRVDEDLAMGVSLGVQGTPTTILVDNTTGKRLTLSGAQPVSAVMSAVRSLQESR